MPVYIICIHTQTCNMYSNAHHIGIYTYKLCIEYLIICVALHVTYILNIWMTFC